MSKVIQDLIVKIQIILLSIYVKGICKVEDECNNIYNNYPTIAVTTDYILYFLLYIHSLFYQYYIEPFDNKWIYTAYLSNINNNYVLNEEYHFYNKYHLASNKFMQSLAIESLEHIKEKENYIIMINYENNTNIKNNINIDLSKDKKIMSNPFMTICYIEKDTKKKIDIDIPKKYLIEDNEILGPCFVYRLLKYKSEYFEFKKNYTIEIMDQDCNVFNLSSQEYIKLKNNSYEKLTLKN